MKQNKSKFRPNNNPFIKYSTLGFEMIAAILIGSYIGSFLDDYFQSRKPYLTLLFMLLGVATSIFVLIRGVSNPNDDEKTRKD